jgi:hypothetical protein
VPEVSGGEIDRLTAILDETKRKDAADPVGSARDYDARSGVINACEERIIRMRFGLGVNSDHTLEEVGQQFSLTRERIRQIEPRQSGSSSTQAAQECLGRSSIIDFREEPGTVRWDVRKPRC